MANAYSGEQFEPAQVTQVPHVLFSRARRALLAGFMALFVLAIIPGSCRPARAQGVEMAARGALGGFCKEGEWVPLAVEVSNRGPQVEGMLRVEVPNMGVQGMTTYMRPVVLGETARKRVTLYVKSDVGGGRFQIELRTKSGVRAKESLMLTAVPREDLMIAVVDPERGALAYLTGQRGGAGGAAQGGYGHGYVPEIRVASADARVLPDAAQGYEMLDLLVIGEVSAQELSAAAKAAIAEWVKAGGCLVIIGGRDWARLGDEFYREMLPVEPQGAAALERYDNLTLAFGGSVAGATLVTRAVPKPGTSVRLRERGLPLIVEGSYGSGRTVFLAFDALRPPFRGWAGQRALWGDLLNLSQEATPLLNTAMAAASAPQQIHYMRYSNQANLLGAVLDIPAMRTPPFWSIAIFLLSYIVVLVPVNYFVLKRRNRRELAWITTPVIVLVFVLLAYGIGYGMKGGKLIVNQISLLETRAGAKAAGVTSLAGVFSPAKTTYKMGLEEGRGVISEVPFEANQRTRRDLTVLETEEMSLPEVPMNMWSMRIFKLENTVDLAGGLEADLRLEGEKIVGEVTNRTGMDLINCHIRAGKEIQQLKRVRDGETVKVNLKLGRGKPPWLGNAETSQNWQRGGGNIAASQPRQIIQEALLAGLETQEHAGRVLLVGWFDKKLSGLKIDEQVPKPSYLGYAVFHLPLKLVRRGGVDIPYGMMRTEVVEEEGVNYYTYSQTPSVDIEDGHIILEYRLPEAAPNFRIDGMKVHATFREYNAGQGNATVELFNWKKAKWEVISSNSGEANVPNEEAYLLLPDGVVRAKFNYPKAGGYDGRANVSQLDVAVRGIIE